MTKYTYETRGNEYIIKRGKKRVAPSEVCRQLNMKWGRYARQLSPKNNSIILIKKPKGQSDIDFGSSLQQMADEILARLGITCFLIGLEDFSDFHLLSEKRMEELGYLRSDRVLALVTDSFENINKRLEEEEE